MVKALPVGTHSSQTAQLELLNALFSCLPGLLAWQTLQYFNDSMQ